MTNEIPASLVDFMEFYLLNYFKPGLYQQTQRPIKVADFLTRLVVLIAISPI